MPKSDPILAEMPAKQHQIAAFGVVGGEVDEPAVEVLHLHAGSLEIGDQQPDLLRDLVDGILRLLDACGIETATVAGDLVPKLGEALSVGDETPARSDEPLDERRDDAEGFIRLLFAEEPHTC